MSKQKIVAGKNEYLTKKHAELNQMQPFTKKEQSELSNRDRAFIRDIQIKFKLSKRNAITKYKDTIIKGDKAYKKLQKDTTSYIKELYPTHDKKAKDLSIKEPQKTGKKKIRLSESEFKKVLRNTSSEKVKNRLVSAHKKYPDASYYEIKYGVNSVKSQKYRIKNNRPEQYEGRVIKK